MTLGECIHGLEIPLCDICYPRKAPEPVRAARPPRTARSAERRAPRAERAPGAPAARIDLDTYRVQHVTPIENLDGILSDGAIRAGAAPAIDLSSATTRELRATTDVPGGGTAADRVPFYLGPEANRWLQLRAGALGPAWSDAARSLRPADTVALVAGLGRLGDVVLADGDAAATTTRFASLAENRAGATTMLQRLVADQSRLDEAEALGPSAVELEAISLVVVANEPVRERVRSLIEDAGLRIRVAVNPPWFAVP